MVTMTDWRFCWGCNGAGYDCGIVHENLFDFCPALKCQSCLGSGRIAPIDTHLDARSDVSQWDLFVSEELERYKALPWLRSEA